MTGSREPSAPVRWGGVSTSDTVWWVVPIATLVAAVVIHLVQGPGYVLDDWYSVRGAVFDGVFGAVEEELRAARPGALVVYAVTFGLFPENAWWSAMVQSFAFVVAGGLALLVLRRFVPPVIAALVVVLWAVQPNHLSIETWPSVTVATVSLALLLAGCVLVADPECSRLAYGIALALFVGSVWSYESSIVVAGVAILALPWINGRLDLRRVLVGWGVLLLSGLWILANWHSSKRVRVEPTEYLQVVQAHLGWGVVREGAWSSVVLLVGLVGLSVALARLLLPSFRHTAGRAEWLVVAGLVTMIAGSISFIAYFYAPIGAGDRVSYVSSLGGAMVWGGIIWMAWRARRPAGATVLVLVLVLGLVTRVERSVLWATAKDDAARIVAAVRTTDPTCEVVHFGPAPIQQENVLAFLDQSNVDAAVQVALGREDVRGVMTFSEGEFASAPSDCRVDVRQFSKLVGDVVVVPTT
jgi:hypothetical protein